MRCLLVNPDYHDTYWSLRHMLPLVRRRWLVAPLPLITAAALRPPAAAGARKHAQAEAAQGRSLEPVGKLLGS